MNEPSSASRTPFIIILILLLAITGVQYFFNFNGLGTDAAMDHAQIARNVARGQGMTTNWLRPIQMVSGSTRAGLNPFLSDAQIHEQEAIRLNLQQLKNQLNPHFLFNALNSLSALITTDPGVARKFILEMSKVYRYVLEKRKENLSKLEEEVEFIRHYYFLQKIRFGEQLNLHLADNLTTVNGRIPAMSLQLIFENALKYNEITHRYPLDIDIYAEVGAVIVENSYHPRTDMPEASFGVGMESIQEIYRYYADVQPEYEIKEGKFICRLPLVE